MAEWELSQEQQPGNPNRPEELKEAEQPAHTAQAADKADQPASTLSGTDEVGPGMPESGIPGMGARQQPQAGKTSRQLTGDDRQI
jgi:hypothetical protein